MIGLLAAMASGALAAGTKVCVPAKEGAAIVTAKAGACEAGYTKTTLPGEAEQEKIEQLLPYVNFVQEGVDKKPTVQISGANLQVINGSGLETTINGTGNLILGYDEKPGTQTGSHNLLLGGTSNSYTSYGGIVGGYSDRISGGYASVLDGAGNTAQGYASTIAGGFANKTTTNYSTVSGGCSNLAGSGTLSVNAFCTETTHTSYFPSILGGTGNQASAENSTVSGGESNLAGGTFASSVSGGKENKATGEEASVSGGGGGEASGPVASVTGGRLGKAHYFASTVLGGLEEATEADYGVTP
jgi:hypothetical protein